METEEQKVPGITKASRWTRNPWIVAASIGAGVVCAIALSGTRWQLSRIQRAPLWGLLALTVLASSVIERRRTGRWRSSALRSAGAMAFLAVSLLLDDGWAMVFGAAAVGCLLLGILPRRRPTGRCTDGPAAGTS
jgi:hypothetical protein